jgi:hypothetical protein
MRKRKKHAEFHVNGIPWTPWYSYLPDDIVEVAVSWYMRLSLRSTLIESPAVQRLEANLLSQLRHGVLGRVARVHIYGLPIQIYSKKIATKKGRQCCGAGPFLCGSGFDSSSGSTSNLFHPIFSKTSKFFRVLNFIFYFLKTKLTYKTVL